MQAHTNQTLQELKAKVEGKIDQARLVLDKGQSKHAFTSPQIESRIDALKDVLQLIDVSINE